MQQPQCTRGDPPEDCGTISPQGEAHRDRAWLREGPEQPGIEEAKLWWGRKDPGQGQGSPRALGRHLREEALKDKEEEIWISLGFDP